MYKFEPILILDSFHNRHIRFQDTAGFKKDISIRHRYLVIAGLLNVYSDSDSVFRREYA